MTFLLWLDGLRSLDGAADGRAHSVVPWLEGGTQLWLRWDHQHMASSAWAVLGLRAPRESVPRSRKRKLPDSGLNPETRGALFHDFPLSQAVTRLPEVQGAGTKTLAPVGGI